MNAAFFSAVRETVFGGSISQSQVDGINVIEEAWTKHGDGDDFKLGYILGTAYHETARTMQPVRETLAKTDAKAKEILTKAWKAGKLSWVSKDYWSGGFFGRGYVQLTHKANYEKAGKELGLDLVKDPSKAMIPEVAAIILVRGCMEGWFTGKKLGDYINKSGADYRSARRVVNGTDRAEDIARVSTTFYRAIEVDRAADKYRADTQYTHSEPAKPANTPYIPTGNVPSRGSPLAAIIALAAAIATGLALGWQNIVNFIMGLFA